MGSSAFVTLSAAQLPQAGQQVCAGVRSGHRAADGISQQGSPPAPFLASRQPEDRCRIPQWDALPPPPHRRRTDAASLSSWVWVELHGLGAAGLGVAGSDPGRHPDRPVAVAELFDVLAGSSDVPVRWVVGERGRASVERARVCRRRPSSPRPALPGQLPGLPASVAKRARQPAAT
jgi:hypothetical protein